MHKACCHWFCLFFFFFKQKTAYEMRISDWSSDVCSSDLGTVVEHDVRRLAAAFKPHALQVRLAGILHETLAGGGGSREGHAIHVGMQAQRLAGLQIGRAHV